MPLSQTTLKLILNNWFINKTNEDLLSSSLPCISPLSSFSRQRYVCENGGCEPLAMFRMNNAGLGNRAPRPGRMRTVICSLCGGNLDEFHVAFSCPQMDDYRHRHTDIAYFINMCRTKGIYPIIAFRLYMRGLDWNMCAVSTTVYLKRGRTLQSLTDSWLLRTE